MAPKAKVKAKAKAKAVLQAPANVIQLNAQQLHAQHQGLLEAPPYSQCEGRFMETFAQFRLFLSQGVLIQALSCVSAHIDLIYVDCYIVTYILTCICIYTCIYLYAYACACMCIYV